MIPNNAFSLFVPNSTLHRLAQAVDISITSYKRFLSLVKAGHSSKTIKISEFMLF